MDPLLYHTTPVYKKYNIINLKLNINGIFYFNGTHVLLGSTDFDKIWQEGWFLIVRGQIV
jgi:hypothetical protein